MGGGGGGYGQGGDVERKLIRWKDTAANRILGTEPNYPLDYHLGLKLHHPIMSMLGEHGSHLYIEIYGVL